jgi:ornithine--oxo-acid transaminase
MIEYFCNNCFFVFILFTNSDLPFGISKNFISIICFAMAQPASHNFDIYQSRNPLACAVARQALKVLLEENMIENAQKMGAYFLAELKNIQSPTIKDVRGIGLMIAIELNEGTKGGAWAICESLLKMGILCKETHTYTIRFVPPFIIQKEDIDWDRDLRCIDPSFFLSA